MNKPTIFIIPGNGGPHFAHPNWYIWLRNELGELGYPVIANDLPDPVEAHQSIWLPHIIKQVVDGQNTILVGHSSGAVAAMRYLEDHSVQGAIIVGCNYTDLGDAGEKAAGWYDNPWDWESIREHAGWIEQFHSLDDPYIPVVESRYIHEQIKSVYHEYADRGHFMESDEQIPEIVEIITRRISANK